MENSHDKDKPQVSFGFKKKFQTKVDESKIVKDRDDVDGSKDFLTHVDKELLNKKEKKKEIIIPLIQRNRWRSDGQTNVSNAKDSATAALQDEAAKELIAESTEYMQGLQSDADNEFANMEVPLLLKNQVPEGYETDDRLDVALRAEQATPANYEEVPIEAFGMAMIRGMGWDPNVGIGQTFKQNTKVLEATVRPKGLGLGASAPQSKKSSETQNKTEEKLEIKMGAYVLVESGTHKRKYGVVQGLDVDNAQCVVKFALGGKTATVSEYSLKPVTKKEYLSYGKDLSRLSQAHLESEASKNIGKDGHTNGEHRHKKRLKDGHDHSNTDHSPSRKKQRHDEKQESSVTRKSKKHDSDRPTRRDQEKNSGSKRHREQAYEKNMSDTVQRKQDHRHPVHYSSHGNSSGKSGSKYSSSRTWLQPHLKVRMISQKYKKGKFYKEKLIVEDVLDMKGRCSCRTDNGALLDDITEEMLETVVPRSSSDAYVIITSRGKLKHDGKLAKILEKDKVSCEAVLQLIEDRDVAIRASFDDICEYAGDIESDVMF